jgi:hypothetical protein
MTGIEEVGQTNTRKKETLTRASTEDAIRHISCCEETGSRVPEGL